MLIIGGGVVGNGVALEASSRGLKVALVERGDLASGTSSRSTKLIHGGVRYLEQAIYEFDVDLLKLVAEALRERGHMLRSASYMNHALPIIIPIYRWWEVPYIWFGCKLYDVIAKFDGTIPSSYYIPLSQVKERFPNLNLDKAKGAIVYFDGQMNDSRHTTTLALTAEEKYNATIANYVAVDSLIHDSQAQVTGAIVHDTLENTSFPIRAKTVVNAAGVYGDNIRKMDDPSCANLIIPSDGVHITLPSSLFPKDMGMLIPKTSDGRVLFCLPWEGGVIAGTTDSLSELSDFPIARESDITFIKQNLDKYLAKPIEQSDILSVWCGTRPLVKNPKYMNSEDDGNNTKRISREHVVHTAASGLVSVLGGKYTTYRQMAEDTVNAAIKVPRASGFKTTPEQQERVSKSVTRNAPLIGMDEKRIFGGEANFKETIHDILRQAYSVPQDVSEHLIRNYGTNALKVAECGIYLNKIRAATNSNPNDGLYAIHRLAPSYPFIEGEILYAVLKEKACTPSDVLFRRTRLGFIDQHKIASIVQPVADIMAHHLNWDHATKQKMIQQTLETAEKMSLEGIKKGQ